VSDVQGRGPRLISATAAAPATCAACKRAGWAAGAGRKWRLQLLPALSLHPLTSLSSSTPLYSLPTLRLHLQLGPGHMLECDFTQGRDGGGSGNGSGSGGQADGVLSHK
jgi:hypothetical protein